MCSCELGGMGTSVRIDRSSHGNQPGKEEEAWYEKKEILYEKEVVEVLW